MSNEAEEIGEHSEPTEMDDNQLYAAEYKDGQLQIVEMTPFDRGPENPSHDAYSEDGIELTTDLPDEEGTKYLQLLDTGKGLQLDLLNFTLVKCADGSNSYQMVSTDSTTADDGGTTITCVLSSDDVDDIDNNESYVMVHTEDENDPYVYLQTSNTQPHETEETPADNVETNKDIVELPTSSTDSKEKKELTPLEILEKAKALQRAKSILAPVSINKRGRKRKSDLPPPMELLSSPGFKLYLYSCKMCSYKCNAVKEMQAHRAAEHSSGKGGSRGPSAGAGGTLQCARCPYRGHTHTQLMKHLKDAHPRSSERAVETVLSLNSQKVQEADVLVCGACGFESGDRPEFKNHIEVVHGATGLEF